MDIKAPKNHTYTITDRLLIKRNGIEIGSILLTQITRNLYEIGQYRIFGFITDNRKIEVIIKPTRDDKSGRYECILVTGGRQIHLKYYTIGDASSPRKINTINNIMPMQCGSKNQETLWYFMIDGQLRMYYTDTYNIIEDRIIGFTKMYCESFYTCETSDILHADGSIETLTWDNDFRYPITQDKANSAVVVKSALWLTITMLILN